MKRAALRRDTMGTAEILVLAGEHGWKPIAACLAVLILRSRPARAISWMLSTRIWDRYLRGAGAPPEVRLRLIISAAERDLGQAPEPGRVPDEEPPSQARAS